MKNKKLIAVLALLAILLGGFVSAYMRKGTPTIENDFIPATVACRVNEDFNGQTKSNITVTNTGNYEEQVRVRLVSYWINDKGEVVFKESESVDISSILNNADWMADTANNTYYYIRPIQTGQTTSSLLKDGATITLKQDTDGTVQVIDVFAEAILASVTVDGPAKTVTDAWGVTINGQGKSTSLT